MSLCHKLILYLTAANRHADLYQSKISNAQGESLQNNQFIKGNKKYIAALNFKIFLKLHVLLNILVINLKSRYQSE